MIHRQDAVTHVVEMRLETLGDGASGLFAPSGVNRSDDTDVEGVQAAISRARELGGDDSVHHNDMKNNLNIDVNKDLM